MTINERFLKLSSKVPYPSDISLGDDITVTIGNQVYIFNCVKIEMNDRQDQTVDVTHVLKCAIE